ncbi:chromosome partition protein Smc [Marinithermofilum abyssi]|uniref:Chromosome partition protein Smc n=1 Tax=Marinithermofilum abyssi TaxID=1571185 RepID=A0A8J2VDR0_9BACL|nr:chromosome segregation protein SMC [Marinithermofilum abyssi]GGE16558.1 chromosome partition protein Smc [Marinithermofilum abyssi]
MHLKRLELNGFKSFANRTELEIVPGVTAVVGPNGSGKSNVTDGIRWVLGEQSAKSLRGASMQDVIFSGSDSRKPVGYCEVSITFDNTDQRLNLDYSEVTVTRRVYRSGESEYYINKQACRLKDITELFMDTGIGKEAYSMIGQGRIDEILSTKSEDRRAIFEEAAGIVKYKTRKREAEKKLDTTDQNLSRIYDLISELETQVEPLAEQAEKAEKYKQLKEDLSRTEVGLYVHRIESLHQAWQEATEQLKGLSGEREHWTEEVQQREKLLEELQARIKHQEQELERLQVVLLQVSEELEKAEGQREVLLERAKNRTESREQTRRQLEELQGEKERVEAEHTRQLQQWEETKKRLSEVESQLQEAEAKLAEAGAAESGSLDELKQRLQALINEETALKSEERHLAEQQELRTDREEVLTEKEGDLERKERVLTHKMDDLIKKRDEVETALQKSIQSYMESEARRQQLEQKSAALSRELRQAEQRLDALRSRREIVKDMEADHAGFLQGVKEVLKARDRGNPQLKGIHGAVAQLIQVPAEFEAAMETALGGAMQHLVVEDEETGRRGIRFLKESRAGRATFLPLDVIQGRFIPASERDKLASAEGFVGIAADLVKTEERYRKVVQSLLGQVIVSRTLEDANRIARRVGYRFRIVTLDGDVVNPGGSMSGGSRQKSKSNLLGRSRQVDELDQQIAEAEQEFQRARAAMEKQSKEMGQLENQLEALRKKGEELRLRQQELKGSERELAAEKRSIEAQLESVRSDLETLFQEGERTDEKRAELANRLARVREEQREVEAQIAASQEELEQQATEKDAAHRVITDWKIEAARLNQERDHLEADCRRLQKELDRINRQIEETREQLAQLETGVADNDKETERLAESAHRLREEKARILEQLQQAKQGRDQLQAERSEKEKHWREAQQHLRKQEETIHQQEVQVNRMDVELNHLLEKLAEEYEISFELARERYEKPADAKEAEREVRSLKSRIAALGEVNLGAIEEFERLNGRLDFLKGQRDDLVEAKESLFDVIHTIESEMSRRFQETFDAIRAEFQDVFVKMFGGGRADLRLTEPENLLNTGIEIVAQPPGKKLQNLGLLSGGERALAAIALLFAVLRYKPVPFCVLDEVDAALDEANLTRFTRYLREFSQNTQFIIITHRKRTMEGADVLYGVTMQEAGVSKIVSVKLEDYEEQKEAAAARE